MVFGILSYGFGLYLAFVDGWLAFCDGPGGFPGKSSPRMMIILCLRKVLRDALRRLLDLFGETLKAAVTLKSRISERAGLLLDHVDAADTSDARLAGTCQRWLSVRALCPGKGSENVPQELCSLSVPVLQGDKGQA